MPPLKFRAVRKSDQVMGLVTGLSFQADGLLMVGVKWDDGTLGMHGPDEVIVMQSTGLRDKNGMEIYEGDIVQGKHFDEVFVSAVVWGGGNEHQAGFYFDAPGYYWETDGLYNPWDGLEVIGNVHQNPGLLPR